MFLTIRDKNQDSDGIMHKKMDFLCKIDINKSGRDVLVLWSGFKGE
jgi:hypothetical protein